MKNQGILAILIELVGMLLQAKVYLFWIKVASNNVWEKSLGVMRAPHSPNSP
jgi:hypothetical protein